MADAQAPRHQVQVVVPEHHPETRPQPRPLLARPTQHVERPRTAVHEIAGHPEPVAGGVEGEPAQQPAQRSVAALDVPDRVGGAWPAGSLHAPIFSSTPDPVPRPLPAQREPSSTSTRPSTSKGRPGMAEAAPDRKSTRLNSSHSSISYAVF